MERYEDYDSHLCYQIDTWVHDMPLVSVDIESRTGESEPFRCSDSLRTQLQCHPLPAGQAMDSGESYI